MASLASPFLITFLTAVIGVSPGGFTGDDVTIHYRPTQATEHDPGENEVAIDAPGVISLTVYTGEIICFPLDNFI